MSSWAAKWSYLQVLHGGAIFRATPAKSHGEISACTLPLCIGERKSTRLLSFQEIWEIQRREKDRLVRERYITMSIALIRTLRSVSQVLVYCLGLIVAQLWERLSLSLPTLVNSKSQFWHNSLSLPYIFVRLVKCQGDCPSISVTGAIN
jgi:hypothetical protein